MPGSGTSITLQAEGRNLGTDQRPNCCFFARIMGNIKLTRQRDGFTLIELLIVIVIIGILAAIAIPKFATTKEKAYLTVMKTDLRNLATAEEAYFFDFVAYTTSPTNYTTTTGVTGLTIATTGDGWTATVGHGLTTKTCAIFIGSTSAAPATKEGEPKCST